MDPDEFIRGLVSVGLVITMSIGASCQGAAGHEARSGADVIPTTVPAQAAMPATEKQAR